MHTQSSTHTQSTIQRGTTERRVTAASLQRIPLFHEVPEETLAPLAAASSRQVLAHGDLLWRPGETIEAVFALAKGGVCLHRPLDDGEEVAVALLGSGQVCGLAGLDVAFRPTTVARTLADGTVVYRIPRRDFVRFLRENQDIALRVVAVACRRTQDAYELFTLPDARARVAYVLARLAAIAGERTVWTTHEELAALTRVSREEVTRRVLPDLKGRGLIAYEQRHRGISVLDSAGLLDLARHRM